MLYSAHVGRGGHCIPVVPFGVVSSMLGRPLTTVPPRRIAPARPVAIAILSLGFLFLVVQAILSLRWPLVHDGAFLHFIAFQIDRFSAVPYAGIHETSLPLVYLFHLAIGRTLGYGDFAFHVVDVVYLAVLLCATWRMMRPLGALVAAAAALVFGLLYQSFGPGMTLQRDYLALLPVAVAIALASATRHRRRRFLAIGALFGVAVSIKPHFGIMLPPVWLYALAAGGEGIAWPRPDGRALAEAALWTGVGLALVVTLPLLWVWRVGAWAAFREIMTRYLPLYSQLTGAQRLLAPGKRWRYLFDSTLRLGDRAWLLLPAVAGVVFGLADGRRPPAQRRLVVLLATLALLAVVYTPLAGKFWPYHWMPFFYFAVCCGALVLLPVQERDGRPRQWVALAIFIAGLALTLRPAADTTRQLRGLPPAPAAEGRADVMVEFLEQALRPGDSVQPLDGVTGGGAVALRRLGLPSATPYINDTQFYHHTGHPVIEALRLDFMTRLAGDPPRFFISVPDASRPSGPGTTDFAELERFIAARYRVALERDGIVIYERVEPE